MCPVCWAVSCVLSLLSGPAHRGRKRERTGRSKPHTCRQSADWFLARPSAVSWQSAGPDVTVVLPVLEKKVLLQEMDAFKKRKRRKNPERSSKVLFLLLERRRPSQLNSLICHYLNYPLFMLHRCTKALGSGFSDRPLCLHASGDSALLHSVLPHSWREFRKRHKQSNLLNGSDHMHLHGCLVFLFCVR